MSENVKRVRELLDAANRRDRAAWFALCDADLEHVPSRDWPESVPVRGREAAWDFFMGVLAAFDGAVGEAGELLDVPPDRVVLHSRAHGRGTASGAEVDWSYWVVLTFRDGKMIRSEWFADRAEALAAAAADRVVRKYRFGRQAGCLADAPETYRPRACSRFDPWMPDSQSAASRRASTGSSPRRSASM